ncbi:nuclear pore complex protein NUP54-like [Silene latifolia]|uniref:nuclear pore complex protein NUP54-like n=1 Tax=Silene latifolia TaxID=37657 RepID=UPI003D76EB15
MIRLLRVVQPLYKGPFQRLLWNLSAHSESRTALVKILMEMLMLNKHKTPNQPSDSEPLYRLYGCPSHVMYSRPQLVDGVPPLVSRRVLETLTYLARNHPYVAKILLELRLPLPSDHKSENTDQVSGKAMMVVETKTSVTREEDLPSIALLLGLLNQPLYLRSIAHLEQLLNLLDVILDNAGSRSDTSKPELPTPEQHTSILVNSDLGTVPSEGDSIPKVDESTQPSTSGSKEPFDALAVLLGLPPAELRLLCKQRGKAFCLPLMKGEVELAEKSSGIGRQLKGSGAELSRRVQNLLTVSRVHANANGGSISIYLPGSTKIQERSLADMQEVLQQQTDAMARVGNVLKRDIQDMEIIMSEDGEMIEDGC